MEKNVNNLPLEAFSYPEGTSIESLLSHIDELLENARNKLNKIIESQNLINAVIAEIGEPREYDNGWKSEASTLADKLFDLDGEINLLTRGFENVRSTLRHDLAIIKLLSEVVRSNVEIALSATEIDRKSLGSLQKLDAIHKEINKSTKLIFDFKCPELYAQVTQLEELIENIKGIEGPVDELRVEAQNLESAAFNAPNREEYITTAYVGPRSWKDKDKPAELNLVEKVPYPPFKGLTIKE